MQNTVRCFIAFSKKKSHVFFLVVFYLFFHFICHPTYWDDESYRNLVVSVNYNLFTYIQTMYNLQTSRIAIEIVSFFIIMLPHLAWRILDVCMILLLYRDLKWLMENILEYKKMEEEEWLLTLLLCAYPFSCMACAGWKITTLNYLWVVATALYTTTHILKNVVLDKKTSKMESILAVFALIYSSSFESLVPIYLLGFLLSIWYLKYKKNRQISKFLFTAVVIVMISIVLIAVCPGNANRLQDDIRVWMPEFVNLTLLDKLRVGIVTSFMHFVSIPSPIFFILNLCCILGVWLQKMNFRKKMIATLPLGIQILWTFYFFLNYLLGHKTMTYQIPSPLLKGGIDTFEQIGILLSTVVWFASILYSMYFVLQNKRIYFWCLGILLIGCVPEIIVGFSPTVVNSMLRTTIYLYVAMILLIMCMWKSTAILLHKHMWIKRLLYGFCIAGVVMNAVQMLRHIAIYG